MRDNDDDIRGSLERLTDPAADTLGADALWSDLVSRRRRRRARNGALAALPVLLVGVLVAGVFSSQGSDDARSDVAAGRPGAADAPNATVSVSLDRPLSLDVSTSELSESAAGWLQHTITVVNTADRAIRFNYLRSADVLGDREVAVTTDGCTYPDGRGALDFVCEPWEPVTIEAFGKYEFTVTLWKALPGMNPVAGPTGTWEIPVEYWDPVPGDRSADTTPAVLTVAYDRLNPGGNDNDADGPVTYDSLPSVPESAVPDAEPTVGAFAPITFAGDNCVRAGDVTLVFVEGQAEVKDVAGGLRLEVQSMTDDGGQSLVSVALGGPTSVSVLGHHGEPAEWAQEPTEGCDGPYFLATALSIQPG